MNINNRNKILFITPWYPTVERPSHGIFVREHAKAAQLYDDIVLIHISKRNPLQTKLIEIHLENDLNLTEGITTYRYSNKPLAIPNSTLFLELFGAGQTIKQILRSGFKPDLIHAHISRAGFVAVILGKILKCPVIITEQNSAFPRHLLTRSDILKARYAFPRADKVLPVSMALQKGIESYKIYAKFQIVHNVVDTTLFFPNNDSSRIHNYIRLIFVGSIIPVKGIDYLLLALANMHLEQKWHLNIIGTSDEISKYEKLSSEYALTDKVTFHGYLPKNKIAEMMRQSDIFILPSLYETMGCVLIEAMASGLPIVSNHVGGIPEIVDTETGILCKPGDVDSFLDGLTNAIKSLNTFDPIEINRKAIRFSPKVIGKQLHDIYNSLIIN
jgi:L-malate glycosyltransferase